MLRGQVQRQVGTRTRSTTRQGTLVQSDGQFDLALAGPGFFAVETEGGEAYTRNGQFRIDDSGVLQTLEGYPVAWQGARGTIDPTGLAVLVDPEGRVMQGPDALGQLRIVDFEDAGALSQDRRGFYHAQAARSEVPAPRERAPGRARGRQRQRRRRDGRHDRRPARVRVRHAPDADDRPDLPTLELAALERLYRTRRSTRP